MSSEAAEQLLLGPYMHWARESWEDTDGVEAALCTAVAYVRASLPQVLAAAKAEGAREAVERIRHHVDSTLRLHADCEPPCSVQYLGSLTVLLDEEAAR